MKKMLKFLCFFLFVFSFASCSNDDETKNSNSTSSEKKFTVGSIVDINGLKYTVVANSLNETSRFVRAAESKNRLDSVASLVSFERTKKFAEKTFGKNILLVRVSGKVTVPQGEKEKYINAYNAVMPEKIPDGFYETDFFNYNATSDDTTHLYYRDTYLVLNSEDVDSPVGNISAIWNSSYISSFKDSEGNEKTFSEVLVDFSPNLIRNTVPTEFKTYKNDGYFLNDSTTNSEGYVIKEQYPVKECGYYSKNKNSSPKPAAAIHNYFDDNGEWYQGDICLCPIYASENSYSGAALTVKRTNSSYQYYVRGKTGSSVKISFEFNDEGKFKADSNINLEDPTYKDNITYSADVTHYDSEYFPYTSEIRKSIPVSFIKNEDGSVDYGEELYAFVRKWRDIVVENNSSKAAVYIE